MDSLSIAHHDGYLELRPPPFTSVKERLEQIQFSFELIFKSRYSNVLIELDQSHPVTGFKDLHTLVKKIHREDWKIRNKGIFLKMAILVPQDKIQQYEFHQKAYQARDLNISVFESRMAALSWLLEDAPLEHIRAYFQPIVDLKSNAVIGYETLARKIEDDQVYLPEQWLPELLAEEKGSRRLASHMLGLALENLNNIEASQYLSVNFETDDLYPEFYTERLKRYSKSDYTSRLVFEVAERGRIQADVQQMINFIHSINGRIALDDVGAGAARLLGLIDLQPDIIKFDRAITQRISEQAVQQFIVYFSDWGKANNIATLAEGIESEKELNSCLKAGVVYGQGYLFGKPAPFSK